MAQERDESPGYDWEDPSVPAPPATAALPDHGAGPRSAPGTAGGEGTGGEGGSGADEDHGPYGAPLFTFAPQDAEPAEDRRSGILTPWAIVAIVAVQATAAVLCLVLVLGGVRSLIGQDTAPPTAAPPATDEPDQEAAQPRERGTVTDSAGEELGGGIGDYDRPATVGEHTFTWTAWTEGTLSVTALEVELGATLPQSAGEDVLQEGYVLVAAHYEVRYEGPGQLAPVEELWLTGESDLSYFSDVAEGLVPDPMEAISPLGSGEAATFHALFVVPEDEVESFLLGVETPTGETLYYAT